MRKFIFFTVILFSGFFGCDDDGNSNQNNLNNTSNQNNTTNNVTTNNCTNNCTNNQTNNETNNTVNNSTIDPKFAALFEVFESELGEQYTWGGALAVIEGDEITFKRGTGVRDPDTEEPVNSETLFRIGSLTKSLTAISVLQNTQDGIVDLEASLNEYLSDFDLENNPGIISTVKIKHLLTHQGAFYNPWEHDAVDPYRNEDGLYDYYHEVYTQDGYLMAPAGLMYNYSNTGFSLAGLVSEVVSGQYYNDYMIENVFLPLGLSRTFFLAQDVSDDGNYAKGLMSMDGSFDTITPDTYMNPWVRPCGYAWSSVEQLAEYILFLKNGDETVLNNEQRTAMMEPQKSTQEIGDFASYGYGLFIQDGIFVDGQYYNIKLITHNGAVGGYSAYFYYFPELEFGMVFLGSGDYLSFKETLANGLSTLVDLPEPAEFPAEYESNTEKYTEYEGTYIDPNFVGTLNVTKNGENLELYAPELEEQQIAYGTILQPYYLDSFLFSIYGSSFVGTFIYEDGVPKYFRTRFFVGMREDTTKKNLIPPVVDKNRLYDIIRKSSLQEKENIFLP
ncbi:MAG: beta-lactamase family protein [Deltaproteobacteria bacterium]|nr:beta-lactamase family protein [Deltaproteobacteria bacterium]